MTDTQEGKMVKRYQTTMQETPAGLYVVYADYAALQARCEALEKALMEAALSLVTIEEQAGRDEYLKSLTQIRGYAHSRSLAARAALGVHTKEQP